MSSLATAAVADTTAPNSVLDFETSNPTQTSMDLIWTAPGDDGASGTATTYDIRYSTATITEGNWSLATEVTGEPVPSIAGSSELMTVSGLSAGTTYYFAIKTSDEVPNESDISNVSSESTNEESTITITGVGAGVAASIVSFSGQAYPGSRIEVLFKSDLSPTYRNVPLTTYQVSESGEFHVSYTALLSGRYFFALKARDRTGEETGVLTFSVDFNTKSRLVVEDIFIPPTIDFGQGIYVLGKEVKISGYSAVGSIIKLEVDGIIKKEITSDKNGFYEFLFNSEELGVGRFYAKAKQIDTEGKDSGFSFPRAFRITELAFPKADLNEDSVINIVDWSMFLFRWGSEEESLKREIDLDDNGEINIFDFSLFLKAFSI